MEIITSHKIVKVNKEHKCFGCGKNIKKGRKSQYAVFKQDGVIYGHHICLSCMKFIEDNRKWLDNIIEPDEGYLQGDIREFRIENIRAWQYKKGVLINEN